MRFLLGSISFALLVVAQAGCGGTTTTPGADLETAPMSAPDFALPQNTSDLAGVDMTPEADMVTGTPCDPAFDSCTLNGTLVCDAATRLCIRTKPCTMDSECGNYRCGNFVQGVETCYASCRFGPECAPPAKCNPQTLVCAP